MRMLLLEFFVFFLKKWDFWWHLPPALHPITFIDDIDHL